MTAFTHALSGALIHFVWQGAIVALLLWAALFLLRHRSANARYILSGAALAILAIMPMITTALLYLRALPEGAAGQTIAGVSQVITTALPAAAPPQTSWLVWLQVWALPAWSLGVLLFSIRFFLGCKHAFALRRRGGCADPSVASIVAGLARRMGVERPVRILISAMADCPSVVGWLRPVILLPAATLIGLPAQQLEAVLAHELAHIRRHDYLVNLLQMLVETIYFYHPAVWWASKRMRTERELCCDDLAVRCCGDALCYARALTALEKLRISGPPAVAAVAMASAGGPLLYRIQRLVGVSTPDYAPSRMSGLVAVCLALAFVVLNVNWVRAQTQAQAAPAHLEPLGASAFPDFPGVQVDLGSATVIHRTAVEYPEGPLKKGVKGTVQVEVTLDAAGIVSDARVLSGPEELRKAVLQSVLNWHFTHDAARSTRQVRIAFEPPPAGTGIYHEVTAPPFGIAFAPQDLQYGPIESPMGVVGGRLFDEPDSPDRISGTKEDFFVAGRMVNPPNGPQSEQQAREMEKIDMFQRTQEGPQTLEFRNFQVAEEGKVLKAERVFSWAVPKPVVMAGRVLVSIGTPGLAAEVRRDLLSALPVHLGDVLTRDSIDAMIQAVRGFDEHLGLQLVPTDDGQAEMQIAAPMSELHWRALP